PVGAAVPLVYNSDTVDVHPVVAVEVDTVGGGPIPTEIDARLTWDGGTPGSWGALSTSRHSSGDPYYLALQTSSAVSTTGRYSFSVDVKATFSSRGDVRRTVSGNDLVVANDSSAIGAGWSLGGIDRLVSVTGGLVWVYGMGGARYFASAGGNNYTTPAGAFGTLVKNGDNTFTYTAKDKSLWKFDTSGYPTRVQDGAGIGATLTYTSGRLPT